MLLHELQHFCQGRGWQDRVGIEQQGEPWRHGLSSIGASGLIIAIPAQLAYNWYTTKVTRFVRDIETATNMLLETFIEMDSGRYGEGADKEA